MTHLVPREPSELRIVRTYSGENGVLDVLGQKGLEPKFSRVFKVARVPPGVTRANHAHRTCVQLLWAVAGTWRVKTEGAPEVDRAFVLTDEGQTALMVPTLNWVTLTSGSRSDILVVLCSEPYYEDSYIRDRGEWSRIVGRSQ